MTDRTQIVQVAPWPTHLEAIVKACTYRAHEGWTVRLRPDDPRDEVDGKVVGRGTTLAITTCGFDAYHPERGANYRVVHYFIVPAATYSDQDWERWLLERFIDVETHEAMENFVIDGRRPFAPLHGPGRNPYVIHEYMTDVDKRTRPSGEVVDS